MKRLTLLASVLLTISATSVQAQSVICEKFGAGQIIANRVCPLGYVKKGEVGSNSNRGGITAGLQPMYDQLNNNAAGRRERLARQAAAAEAQRQREHEERMLRLRTQQSRSTPPTRSSRSSTATSTQQSRTGTVAGWERWNFEIESSVGDFAGTLTIYRDCSASMESSELGSSKIDRVTKTDDHFGFTTQTVVDGVQIPLTLSTRMISNSAFEGAMTSERGGFDIKGNRNYRNGSFNAKCAPLATKAQDSPATAQPTNPRVTASSTATGSSERGSNLVEDLSALGKLHTDGILTDEEFNAAKRRLLGL